jgi:uncharacterized protein (TIGR03083 family)
MIRDWIASERRELADVLDELSAEQWDAPSLCAGWSVRHVVAHLTMPFRYSRSRFLMELARAGGRFTRMSDAAAQRDARLPSAQLIAAVRDHAEHPWKPPGGGYEAALTHDVIHSLDITCPLAIERHFAADSMRTVLGTLTSPRSLRFFQPDTGGVELRAVDLDWSYGSGAPLLGRAQDLALLLTGRRVAQDAFSGKGAGTGREGTGSRPEGAGPAPGSPLR